jgi:hypothetical protein
VTVRRALARGRTGAKRLALLCRRYAKILLGGVFAAAAAVAAVGYPETWSTTDRSLILVAPCTLIAVLLIETARHDAGHGVKTRTKIDNQLSGKPKASTTHRATKGSEGTFPASTTFRGREADLQALVDWHNRARNRLTADLAAGEPALLSPPVQIYIHGMPGIGKTAVAEELATRLAAQYPDGIVRVRLGTAGEALSPGQVLRELLHQVKWSKELPADDVERLKVFWSATAGKQYLFVLDAARDAEQVARVITAESRCAVIVTSRRDVSGSSGIGSYLLTAMNDNDALSMLYGVSGAAESSFCRCAVRIVEACGNLPLGILSAGEAVSLGRTSMCDVATSLEEPSTRLESLTGSGARITKGLDAEFRWLDPQERRALRLLSLVPADTFVPWVLCSMMDIDPGEAEDLVVRLNNAQYVEFVTRHRASRVNRYRLHPLVRLYAARKLAREVNAEEIGRARQAFEAAYEALIQCLVATVDRVRPTAAARRMGMELREQLPKIAAELEEWTRYEFANVAGALQRLVRKQQADTCWRVARRLGGTICPSVPVHATLDLFPSRDGLARIPDPLDSADVLLAKSATLLALERYREMDETLSAAEEFSAQAASSDPRVRLIRGQVALRRAEALVQVRLPGAADAELLNAVVMFDDEDAKAQRFSRLAKVLRAIAMDRPDLYRPDLTDGTETSKFWTAIQRFEEMRLRESWADAAAELATVDQLAMGDARRLANLAYRRAKLALARSKVAGSRAAERNFAIQAAYSAARSMTRFAWMDNRVGEVRAACLFVRALAAGGMHAEAEVELARAKDWWASDADKDPRTQALRPRIDWADGVMLAHRERAPDAARSALLSALTEFDRLGDGRSAMAVREALDDLPFAVPGQRRTPGDESADPEGEQRPDVHPRRMH